MSGFINPDYRMITPEKLETERQRLEDFYKTAGKSPALRWLTGKSRTFYQSIQDVHQRSGFSWKLHETIQVKTNTRKQIIEVAVVLFVVVVCVFLFVEWLWLKALLLSLTGLIVFCIIVLFKPFDDVPVVLRIGEEGIQHKSYPRPIPWKYFVGAWIKTVEDDESSAQWLIIHYYDELADDFKLAEISFNDIKEDSIQLAIWIGSFKNGIRS